MTAISSSTPEAISLWERWERWFALPAEATPAERRLVNIVSIAFPILWLIYFFYVFLFAYWGVWPLVLSSFISVIILTATLVLWQKQRRRQLALAIAAALILADISLVILFLGWGFGAQYAAITLFLTFMFTSLYPRWVTVAVAVVIMLLFIGWYYYTVFLPPLASVPTLQLAVFNSLNIAATFGTIGLATLYLVNEADRAEQANEELLNNVLPSSIAARLKKKEPTIADGFQNASILFADLVGFTPVSQKLTPDELVEMLDSIFSRFDELVDQYGLEKIKTIGDEYMVASGIPIPRGDHAEALANFALAMRGSLAEYTETHGVDLRMRIGINSGPVVAGVIGKRRFLYDLWGDSVNTASRMESHGIPGEIQITEATRDLLDGQFTYVDRGVIDIKGKGPMQTYLLQSNGHD